MRISFAVVTLGLAAVFARASVSAAELSGHFSLLDSKVIWVRTDDPGRHVLRISGVRSGAAVRLRFPDKAEATLPVPSVYDLGGQLWNPLRLVEQIFTNTESLTQPLSEVGDVELPLLEFASEDLDSWRDLDFLPVAVRAGLSVPIGDFAREHYDQLLKLVEGHLNDGNSIDSLPPFLRCLTIPAPLISAPLPTDRMESSFPSDKLNSCLGLLSPSMVPLADRLKDKPPPESIQKIYYSMSDSRRPDWRQPALILVHPSSDFHFPVRVQAATQRWVDRFHKSGGPVAVIVHDDGFRDSSYYLRPEGRDFSFYSDMGKHLLCENCPEVTFAGGYIDWCLSMAVRSYIANFFRDKEVGTIRVNFAVDSIYTTASSNSNSLGDVTALSEIDKTGLFGFARNRMSQYLEVEGGGVGLGGGDVRRAICPVEQPLSERCRKLSDRVVLAGLHGRDRQGRVYPFLEQNHFRFRIQVNGRDLAYPMGDRTARRTIILNILTPTSGTAGS